MSDSVLILGGGVGGLSAAHELAERGFQVTVVEGRHIPGGKARSIPVPRTGRHGRADLPAEHGFRFFPGFYKHVPDTMRRIPFEGQPNGVLDNLRDATEAQIAQGGGKKHIKLPVRMPHTTTDLREIFDALVGADWGLTAEDLSHFARRLLVLLTSCEARRFGEWERQSWWEFSGAEERSPAYQRFLADGLTRTLVAAQAREMSARTGGFVLLQLLFDMSEPGRCADRLLNGHTNEVWIDPWVQYLRSLGVDYRLATRAEAIRCSDGRITSVQVHTHGSEYQELSADWYVSAVPVEHMARLATAEMKKWEPTLGELHRLKTRWMNGIVFYLREDVRPVHGHVIYIDSPWSLTSISQRQFWSKSPWEFGAGDVGGFLSVDISDWETPGRLTGKRAMECTREEVFEEVWDQLAHHLNRPDELMIDDANLVHWFIDTDVHFPEVNKDHGVRDDINLEPLLVNTVGSWEWRPEAVTGIENFFLASDYVRTYTDLATMEAANEAARRAVNGILERSRSSEKPCDVWPLHEPAMFAPARKIDEFRYERGEAHQLPEEHVRRFHRL